MKRLQLQAVPTFAPRQRGMVLLVSLVFLLLLTMLGISSMQNATLQEKMAGSVTQRNTSFQSAETVLRLGESWVIANGSTLAKCTTPTTCAPPAESTTVTTAGTIGSSGVNWRSSGGGLFGVQNLGATRTPIRSPPTCGVLPVTMYRVTAVFIQGTSRTVLESIYANC